MSKVDSRQIFKEISFENVFKSKCCRCGYCCMQSTCQVAIIKYNVRQSNLCPLMEYDEKSKQATCSVSKDVEIGSGCSNGLKILKNYEPFDFAALSDEAKKSIAYNRWVTRHSHKEFQAVKVKKV